MAEKTDSLPRTVGELRRILSKLDNPWLVDPQLKDEEPLPDYPRGGQKIEKPLGLPLSKEDFTAFLQQIPPSNQFLRTRWIEIGLLDDDHLQDSSSRTSKKDKHTSYSLEESG